MLDDVRVSCPACGVSIVLEIDRSAGAQEYVEDCPACCHPIEVSVDEGPDSRPLLKRPDE